VIEVLAGEAEQTTDAAARLGDAAAELQALVGKFKLAGSDALDFEAAKSAHLSWRARIRSFLDGRGSLTRAEALSHRECVLGRWYYGPGLKHYGHLEGMRALQTPHTELHSVIGQIVELKNQGNHQSAEQKYNDLIALSAEIVERLDALEASLNEPDPPIY
jgi:methyl-accepting chemotaxis protein